MGMAVNVAVSKALAQYEVNPINQAISSQLLSQFALNGFNGLSPESSKDIFLNAAFSFSVAQSWAAKAYPTTTGFILATGPDLLQLAYNLADKTCEMSGICEAELLQVF